MTTHRSVRAFHKRRLIATALMPLVQGDRAVRLLLTQTFEPLKASDRELLINTGRIEVSVPCAGYFAALCRRQGGRAVTLHRRHRMVRQMLHEYATAISTAGHANRSRRLIKCAKEFWTLPNGGCWKLVREFTEVESGKRADRPELEKALKACRKHKAKLVIAKLDRLSRNVHFISGLMERKADFVACDMPSANAFMINVYAAVAQEERRMISDRTKAGLAAAKARGVKLGGPRLPAISSTSSGAGRVWPVTSP